MTCEKGDELCSSHGALATDVKWMHKLMYAILGVLVSAIIYYNAELSSKFILLNDNISSIHNVLKENSGRHELGLAKIDMRVSSLENICCGELKSE